MYAIRPDILTGGRWSPNTPADLSFPVILAADGGLMDGGHRIAEAWLLGHTTIAAVRLVQTPESDYVVPQTGYIIDDRADRDEPA